MRAVIANFFHFVKIAVTDEEGSQEAKILLVNRDFYFAEGRGVDV